MGESIQQLDLFETEADRTIVEEAAAASEFEDVATFIAEGALRFADEIVDEGGPFACPFDDCEATFVTQRQKNGHLGSAEHAQESPAGDFWCQYCGFGPSPWRGVNAHHGNTDHDGPVRRMTRPPDPDELIAPEDLPDHQNRELLEELYEACDGNYTEMCRRHDFDVTNGRVRAALIEFGIHEPVPQGEAGDEIGPDYRDEDWLRERYEAADRNVSAMHRAVEAEGYDVPYRTLLKNLKRHDIHDPTDPPGKRQSWETREDRRDDGDSGIAEAGEAEDSDIPEDEDGDGADDDVDVDDVPPEERVFVLEWGAWGPPLGGTYHRYDECWALTRSDSDREAAPLPWPESELEDDDDWHVCGHCQRDDEDDESAEDVEDGGRDHENVADLQEAYHTTDSIAAAAREFPNASYSTVRQRLIDAGIHDPGDDEASDGAADGADGAAAGGASDGAADGVNDGPALEEQYWQDPPTENPVEVPEWVDEASFYTAIEMAHDVDALCDILGWEDRSRVAGLARDAGAGFVGRG